MAEATPDIVLSDHELSLAAGDRLVLYTDGVVEAASRSGEFFEIERLRNTLRSERSLTGEEWADTLLQRLTHWRGTSELELEDDLTLVVLDAPNVRSVPDRGL